jgi:hypothetical protein
MDVFARTFLPAADEAGVTNPTVSRHLPVFSRCVAPEDPTALVVRCRRPGQPLLGEFLLLLTSTRLVVTRETRMLRRLRLHLNTELRHLHNVSWTPHPRTATIEFSATAVDGVRERFSIRAADPQHAWRLDAVLGSVFRPGTAVERSPARPAARRDLVGAVRSAVALS